MNKVLYVDDESNNLLTFQTVFKKHYDVQTAESAADALRILQKESFDVVISDQRMPGMTGVELLSEIYELYPTTERIILTGYSDVDAIVDAINKGKIFYYATKPWDSKDLKQVLDRAIEVRRLKIENERLLTEVQRSNRQLTEKNGILSEANEEIKKLKGRLELENQYLKKEIAQINYSEEIIYTSSIYDELLKQLSLVAPTHSTVLITGETGTGKELLAKAIHNGSTRKTKNYVKVNCAAIPTNLIESELFGHIKGSFTGAINNKVGLFELADKGTIFLDEIGELPLDMQAKLLRVLQEGEFNRIGESKTIKVDARVIAATNRDLEEEIKNGKFRPDLFFRLNVFPIQNPSLRDHIDDLPALVDHFIKKHSKRIGKNVTSVSKDTLKALMMYSWPGNIRELENYVERAIILNTTGVLDLAGWSKTNVGKHDLPKNSGDGVTDMKEAERQHITMILEKTNWKIRGKGGAAEMLNLRPTTLSSKMKRLGIPTKRKPV